MKLHKLPLLILLFIIQSNIGMENNQWHILTPDNIIYIATLIDNKASFAIVNKQHAHLIQQHTLLQQYPQCLNSKDHMNFMVKYAKKTNHDMINLGSKTGLLCGYDYLKMFSSLIPSEDQLHATITTYKVQCSYEVNPKLPTSLIKPLISFLKGDEYYINAYKNRIVLTYDTNRDRITPLHVAVNLNEIKFAQLFLTQNPTLLNQLPLSGDTDLKMLTPLQIAIYRKYLNMCEFLLSFKNIELESKINKQNLLEYSAITDSFDILKLIAQALKQKYDHKKYISFFTQKLLINTISLKKHRLFVLNEINYTLPGETQPLHIAIQHIQCEYQHSVMEAIKDIGDHPATDINAQDEDGNTPLLLAVHNTYVIKYIDYLLDKGADPTIKNNNLQTALHITYKNDLMNRLLKTDALQYINCQDKDGHTPLYFCIEHGSSANLKILLQAGADPNITDKFGRTPLIHAAHCNQLQKIELLLDYGADPDIQDIKNKKACDYCFEYNKLQELLDKHKKNI